MRRRNGQFAKLGLVVFLAGCAAEPGVDTDRPGATGPTAAAPAVPPGPVSEREALAVAQHKPNVYIDLSGWSPKYFPDILVKYCNSILRKKVLFGSDWPMITPERWLSDFEKIAIKDEIRPDIIKNNAARLLGLMD